MLQYHRHYKHRGDQQTSNNVTLDQPPHILLVHIFLNLHNKKVGMPAFN
jgi:hypothetical protein